MSYLSKTQVLTYVDAVRLFSDNSIQEDFITAFQKLSLGMMTLLENFDAIARQLHTLDLQRLTVPLKPRWDSLRNDFAELLWQFRSNAGIISGRLKIFCTMVLPLVAQRSEGGSSRSRDEKFQVIQSYMNISADHANATTSLLDRALKFNAVLASFHTEFAKFASHRVQTGQKEMRDLSYKIIELQAHVQQICVLNRDIATSDVTHLMFNTLRMVSSSGRKSSRSRVSHQRLILNNDLAVIGTAYEQLDLRRNELAHAHYASQICHSKTEVLTSIQASLSTMTSEEILTFESGLSVFLSVWGRLRNDCTEILHWIRSSSGQSYPSVIASYMDGGNTLYGPIANALDGCIRGIDPSRFMSKT
ncbi:hypothetical protein BDQ12DRAFT_92884 [Crucibulum laeve]|uniref:Uncharacterized protein n=1 Tax=Crucibulum laeve TaxID=68775 RepID=A0A5C3LF42_9AGAR|nr:hypothetical protein BDQ12DRAFT_92884 [Crucibulum laeve]